ncbi:MAG TPA: murein L,D-transpeptidase [Sulfurovum sp.]|nr:murein L,D-transpeptidase [Sulfurovum sp.]
MKNIIFIILLFQALLSASSISHEALSASIKAGISTHATGHFKNSVKSLYEKNGYKSLWVGDNGAQQFSELLDALGDPLLNYKYKQFNQDNIINLSFEIDNGSYAENQLPSALAKLDILITQSYLKLIYFVRVGDVDWALVKRKLKNLKASQDIHAAWEIKPRSMPSAASIVASIENATVHSFLISQIPQENQYRSLISLLEKYQNMPKFSKIGYGKILKPRRSDSRIRQIKKLLQFTGDFPRSSSTGTGYSGDLTRAIRSFKERFNLSKGDYIDNKVINYLNTTKEEYVKKILTNLDILKLYPKRFASNHVQVNIPEFKLRYYQNGGLAFQSDIIVGRIDRPTPLFSDKIKYMVLNPTWTITDNLVKRDLIPVLRKNPNYLQEHDIHVFTSYKKNAPEVKLNLEKLFSYEHSKKAVPYRFVQFPSDQNALGRVKFMFPNKYAVYLHDTDNKSLFKYRYRVYSSGCMRVQKPYDFMYSLLDNAGSSYSSSQIQNIFDTSKTTTIKLKKHIPVHMLYQSVRQENGKAYFFYDVYMYDQIVWESTAGHKKSTFRVPDKRLTNIKRSGARIR